MEHGTFEMTFEWEDENDNPKTSELEFEYWTDTAYNSFEIEIKNCSGDELPEELYDTAVDQACWDFDSIMQDLYEPCY